MFDIVIKNAMIVDGSGRKAFPGEIAIQNGKIAKIGTVIDQPGKQEIDADGHCVTPGFIDIHRHGDAAVFRPDFGKAELRQGITSMINGQCGLSVAPCPPQYRDEIFKHLNTLVGSVNPTVSFHTFAEYIEQVRKQPLPLNVGCCVGNGTVRAATAGYAVGKLSEQQLRTAQEYIRSSIQAGALGVTLGLVYAPENQYDTDDLIEVLSPMRDYNVPLAAHIRGEGRTFHNSLREVLSVAKALDVQLQFSHFKSTGKAFAGPFVTEALEIVESARAQGQKVSIDAYPWTAGASQMYQYIPPKYQEGGYDATSARLSDPVQRAEIVKALESPQEDFDSLLRDIGWENTMITGVENAKNKQFIGLTVTQMAEKLGKTPYDAAFDLMVDERCNVGMIIFLSDEADNHKIIQKDYCSIISDSLYSEDGLPHPRCYASFPKVLSEFVRDKKVLTLENAIHKMTQLPAEVYHLDTKGLIREGMDADIVIFDLNNIQAPATYANPVQFSAGFDYVMVNGVVVLKSDTIDASVHPGTVLTNRHVS